MREETDRPQSGADDAERRALERAAYGRDGGLDAAAALRLQELQAERRRAALSASEEPATSASPDPGGGKEVADALPAPEGEPVAEDAAPENPEDVSASEAPAANRRGLAKVLVASAALLAIGVGAGWALFAPRSDAFPLTEAQEDRRTELADSGYDPGSVRPVGEAEGALAWFATQDAGETRCLILDAGADSAFTCLPKGEVAPGLYASIAVPGPAAADEGDAYAVDSITATMLFSTTDEPMVSIQRWGQSSALVDQFGAEHRPRAKELIDDGYTLGLTLLGSFRGQPVWLGDRASEEGPTQRCLIVDVDGSRQCAAMSEAIETGLGVQVVDTEQTSGEVLSVSVLEVAFTRRQVPYLTVTTASTAARTLSGDSYLVTTGPPGDPIRVDIPGRDPEG
ncbi:hypothetical protein M4D51_13730 [Microbacterium sp. p3-SID338]|uniref:hypothetical protein n=1 Tax=unclassified Microbacterium TaxID=2609290 RepID=UPI000C808060|nr:MULTISPECIES: hypothetical protein [unclassified Microbacterium]MCT1396785.1 hypothetical protein [Microbacterium sp. p3-SID338]PMC06644.1 hypothetical protein CJ226_01525 [Microbacterium sp. UMB0228]